MSEANNSAMRVAIALRAALIAKQSLEMMNLPPLLCQRQIHEIKYSLIELEKLLSPRPQPESQKAAS